MSLPLHRPALAALLLSVSACAPAPPPASSRSQSPSFTASQATSSITSPPAAAADKVRPLFVESSQQRTFGARAATPAGTVFTIRVVQKAENNAFRLHRCADPCKSSTTIAMWKPETYKAGDELSWRTAESGMYYLWNQDTRTEGSIPAFSNEFLGKRIRIVYGSGAIIEAWYTVP